MPPTPKPTFVLLLILIVQLARANHALAEHGIPEKRPNTIDKTQPWFLIEHEGSYLVPGVGRFMFPKMGHGYNPFTYNPIPGTNTGIGDDNTFPLSPDARNPVPKISGRTPYYHTHIPQDRTFLPSPKVGIPIQGIYDSPSPRIPIPKIDGSPQSHGGDGTLIPSPAAWFLGPNVNGRPRSHISQSPISDDMFLPNPVVGVPIPEIGGRPPSHHHKIPRGKKIVPSPNAKYPVPGYGDFSPSLSNP